jgi:hypothetical protein
MCARVISRSVAFVHFEFVDCAMYEKNWIQWHVGSTRSISFPVGVF